MNNTELAQLIRDVVADIEVSTADNVHGILEPLREHVKPNCHVGRGAEMNATNEGFRLQLEWYAGQLLHIADTQKWFAMNSCLNCVDKFTQPY